ALHLELAHQIGAGQAEVTGGGDEVLQRLFALQPQDQFTVGGPDRRAVVGLDPQRRFTGRERADDLADRHRARGHAAGGGHRAPTALSYRVANRPSGSNSVLRRAACSPPYSWANSSRE